MPQLPFDIVSRYKVHLESNTRVIPNDKVIVLIL